MLKRIIPIVCAFLIASCSDNDPGDATAPGASANAQNTETSAPTSYVELGDLDAIRQHGTLRLIAPRFDGADALPREGVPVQAYQSVAEEFSNSLGLNVQWIFVEGFSELIPTLTSGAGDLIVTNLTQTQSRLEQVDFSAPINRVDEVIVGARELNLNELDSLDGITFTVAEGSAFIDSLNRYNDANVEKQLNFTVVASGISDADLLQSITNGEFQATIMDSNFAELLLLDYPDLKIGATLRKDRPIGWAARKNSPQLLQALNQFFVSHFLSTTTIQSEARDWTEIKEHGRLRMLTVNNPASYFMWRGDLMGFDYDLMQRFAGQHNLHLAVIVKNSIPELINALKAGEGDLIAASLTRSEGREEEGLTFSKPYLRLNEQLVGVSGDASITSPEDLAGKKLGVNPDTIFYQRMNGWRDTGIDVELVEYPGVLTEELFARMVEGEFDFMMADSHLVSMEQAYRDNIEVYLEFENNANIAWAMRPRQDQLLEQLNKFIDTEYRGLFYNVTFNKYFVNERKMLSLQADRVASGDDLSPYDEMVQTVADRFGMDWRLLTAQIFQESRFNPNAKSFAGAQGLMQVMPRTAKELGYTNLQDPRTGIEAGVAYLDWLADRFPGDIAFQERIYFQLAAYNAGAGHVRDARRLARQLGYDPDRWFDHVEKAMLLLAKPEYYKKARFGYVRGSEPVNYVREIRARYLAYLNTAR